jgi:hypothetical protein
MRVDATRERLKGVMSAAGRTPELCWVERPTQTTMVVYLKRAEDARDSTTTNAALAGMLEQICRDHGLIPKIDVGGGGGSGFTHHCIRAVTPLGAPTAMEVRLRLGRHDLKGEMLVAGGLYK